MSVHQRSNYAATVLAVLAFFALAWVCTIEFTRDRDSLPWWKFSEGSAESVKTGRPLLLVFGAQWCAPCKEMEQTTFADDRVQEVMKKEYVPVHIDIDDVPVGKGLAERYTVNVVPTIMILSATGAKQRWHEGYMQSQEFLFWLDNNRVRDTTRRTSLREGLSQAAALQRTHLVILVKSPEQYPEEAKKVKEAFYLLDIEKRYVVSWANAEETSDMKLLDSLQVDSKLLGSGEKLILLGSDGHQLGFHAIGYSLEARELKEFLEGEASTAVPGH